jgi:hypothetical protein
MSIVYIYNYGSIFDRWTFDGGDARSPHLLNLIFYGLIIIAMIMNFFLTSYVSGMFIFFIKIYFIIVGKNLINSRLQSYITMNIPRYVKYNVFIVYNVIFWTLIMILYINFDPSIVKYELPPIFTSEQMNYFVYVISTSTFGKDNPLIWILTLLNLILILWFDITEKRKKHVRRDLLFFVPLVVILLNRIDDFMPINTVILLILDYAYLLAPTFLVVKEASSIIKHSDGVDSRINEIKSIIKKLSYNCVDCKDHPCNCKLGNKQKYQLNYIANILSKEESLRNVILRKKFFGSVGYNNVIDRIQQECRDREIIGQINTPV